MSNIDHLENHYAKHYSYLKGRNVQYDYKLRKAARIAEIAKETGGLGELVLEIGVGSGAIAAGVSRAGTLVVGTDIAPAALLRAKEYCAGERVRLLFGSGFRLPFRDETFPLVYASQVLHLFDSEARATLLTEVHRILQPSGRFIFDLKNVWSHPLAYYQRTPSQRRRNFPSEEEVRALLDRCAFGQVETRPGLLPFLKWTRMSNIPPLRAITHTRFFVAWRS